MAEKEGFLKGVRAAMERGRHPVPETASRPPERPQPEDLTARAQEARRRASERRDEALATLLRMAPLQEWRPVRVASRQQAAEAIADIAAEVGAKLAVRSAQAAFQGMPLDEALSKRGVTARVLASRGGAQSSPAALRDLAAGADMGITAVDWMVAETATAVMTFQTGHARTTSLLPPVHVAVVEAHQVVPTLDDALVLCQEQLVANGWSPHAIHLISGPSRTGDIEQTIVVGVHGPRTVYLVLIG